MSYDTYKYEVTSRWIPHSTNSKSFAMFHSDYFWPLFDQWSRVIAAVSLLVSLFAICVSLVIVKYDSEFNPRHDSSRLKMGSKNLYTYVQ